MPTWTFTRPDGGLSVVRGAPREQLEELLKFASNEEYEAFVLERSIPADAINVTKLNDGDLPERDEFRNAWQQQSGKIGFDMAQSRNIWRDKMRGVRQSKLDALDRLYNKAVGQGKAAEAAAIEAKRQELRDVTAHPAIDAATSPTDLKAIWPDVLK